MLFLRAFNAEINAGIMCDTLFMVVFWAQGRGGVENKFDILVVVFF